MSGREAAADEAPPAAKRPKGATNGAPQGLGAAATAQETAAEAERLATARAHIKAQLEHGAWMAAGRPWFATDRTFGVVAPSKGKSVHKGAALPPAQLAHYLGAAQLDVLARWGNTLQWALANIFGGNPETVRDAEAARGVLRLPAPLDVPALHVLDARLRAANRAYMDALASPDPDADRAVAAALRAMTPASNPVALCETSLARAERGRLAAGGRRKAVDVLLATLEEHRRAPVPERAARFVAYLHRQDAPPDATRDADIYGAAPAAYRAATLPYEKGAVLLAAWYAAPPASTSKDAVDTHLRAGKNDQSLYVPLFKLAEGIPADGVPGDLPPLHGMRVLKKPDAEKVLALAQNSHPRLRALGPGGAAPAEDFLVRARAQRASLQRPDLPTPLAQDRAYERAKQRAAERQAFGAGASSWNPAGVPHPAAPRARKDVARKRAKAEALARADRHEREVRALCTRLTDADSSGDADAVLDLKEELQSLLVRIRSSDPGCFGLCVRAMERRLDGRLRPDLPAPVRSPRAWLGASSPY